MPFPHMHKEIRCEKGWGRGIARGDSGGSSIPRAAKSPALAGDLPFFTLYWDKLQLSRLGLNLSRLKELSQGSPHTHGKIDNDVHNVLCQQLARRQDHAGLYVVYTYIAQ